MRAPHALIFRSEENGENPTGDCLVSGIGRPALHIDGIGVDLPEAFVIIDNHAPEIVLVIWIILRAKVGKVSNADKNAGYRTNR